jgi:hypothetical protein
LVSGAATFSSTVTANLSGSLFNANNGALSADILTIKGGGGSGAFGFRIEANNGQAIFRTNNFTYNVLMCENGGNVGIGTSSPSQKLEVSGTDNNNLIMSTTTTGAGGTIRIQANEAASYLVSNNVRPLYIQTNSLTAITVRSDQNVGIGTGGDANSRVYIKGIDTTSSNNAFLLQNNADTQLFYVRNDGLILTGSAASSPTNLTNAAAANVFVGTSGILYKSTASSQRFKENINDWDGNGLDTILALKPKTFTYKESYYKYPELKMLGLIAEEVAEVCPYLAEYENEDRTGQVENVRYANIVVPLIKAVQEQNQMIQELNERLNKAGL